MKNKKIIFMVLSCALLISGCGGIKSISRSLQKENKQTSQEAAAEQKEWEKAATSPYGAYPELVTYTLGQMNGANNSNLPDQNTYRIMPIPDI